MVKKGEPTPESEGVEGTTPEPMDGAAERSAEGDGDSEVEVWVVDDEGEEVPLGAAGLRHRQAQTPAAEGDEEERVEMGEEALRKELAEVKDQWVRTLADFDNFRKRTEREERELKRYALFEPMRELLPVVDNLERALAADGSAEDLKRGVELILAQVKGVLRSHGVREVPAAGAPFDPAVHDAVSRHEDDAAPVPTVSEELQRGYTIHERLLRPALVKVAMPASGRARPSDAEEAAQEEG